MSVLAANIRYLRTRFATQTEFGEAIGVGQSTVTRWEKGSDPKPENLLSLAKVAGCTIEQLITTPVEEIEPSGSMTPNSDELERMIERAIGELPVGATNADYRRVVASSLHAQLVRFQASGGYRGNRAEGTSSDTDAPPPKPTKKSGRVKSRIP